MDAEKELVRLAFVLGLAAVVWGAFTKRRSGVFALVAVAVASVAALASYFIFVETPAVQVAVGYGFVAIASAAVAVRHLFGKRSGEHEM